MDRDELGNSLEELSQLVMALSDSLAAQVRRLGFLYKILALALVLALGGLGAALLQLRRLDAVATVAAQNTQNLADLQTRTSDEVLCPLYQLFLGSYNPESQAALDDPELYERNFEVIRRSYAVLQCPGA